MALYSGKVVDGKVVIEGASLPEGADVEVYVIEEDGEVQLTPDMEADLLSAAAQLDRGEFVTWDELRKKLRKIERGESVAQN